MTEEKRGEQRHRTLFKGYIVFNDRRSTVECMIRNMSATGAQLKVASVVGIPDTFDLLVEKETRPCIVARRKEGELGVEFVLPGYEGPLLSVNLTAAPHGGYQWAVMLAAAGHDGTKQLGYKAEGTVPSLAGPLGPFEILVHDEKRPVWTVMPERHHRDVHDLIVSLVVDALARAASANTPSPQ